MGDVDVKELFAAYPNIRHAISWVELMVCQSNDGEETSWDMMMGTKTPMTPQEVVDMIKYSIEDETIGKAKEALKQMDHPEFLTYIKGKMGAM